MRTLFLAFVAVLTFLSPAGADGLLYRLPEDGTYVRFDLELKQEAGGETKSASGSLTMASVGQKEVDGKKCRWIEFRMQMKQEQRERVQMVKVLVPEQHLKAGAAPIDHMIKGWYGSPGKDAKEAENNRDPRLGPVPAFLCGPFKDSKKLVAEDLDTKLGKLSCPGVTGSVRIEQGKQIHDITFDNRLNDKAPFGLVSSRMQFKVTRDDKMRDKGSLILTLTEVGKTAKSELPE